MMIVVFKWFRFELEYLSSQTCSCCHNKLSNMRATSIKKTKFNGVTRRKKHSEPRPLAMRRRWEKETMILLEATQSVIQSVLHSVRMLYSELLLGKLELLSQELYMGDTAWEVMTWIVQQYNDPGCNKTNKTSLYTMTHPKKCRFLAWPCPS